MESVLGVYRGPYGDPNKPKGYGMCIVTTTNTSSSKKRSVRPYHYYQPLVSPKASPLGTINSQKEITLDIITSFASVKKNFKEDSDSDCEFFCKQVSTISVANKFLGKAYNSFNGDRKSVGSAV